MIQVHEKKKVHFSWSTKPTFEFPSHWGIDGCLHQTCISLQFVSWSCKLYALHRFWLCMSHHTSIHHIFSYVKEHSRDTQIKKKKKPELLELNLVRSTNFYFMFVSLIRNQKLLKFLVFVYVCRLSILSIYVYTYILTQRLTWASETKRKCQLCDDSMNIIWHQFCW